MDNIPLSATARTEDKSATVLRQEDQVPCVVYGNKSENLSLTCVYNEIYKAYAAAGESTIVDLTIGDNKKIPVLFHQIQTDPVTDKLIHVDFYAVDMKKEIEANVPVVFEGESPAVKELGGVLVTTNDHITVRCLPADLPHEIVVSLENVVDFESALHVSDLVAPEGVEILDDPEMMLATAQEPRSATEEAEAESAEAEAQAGEEAKTEDAEKESSEDSAS